MTAALLFVGSAVCRPPPHLPWISLIFSLCPSFPVSPHLPTASPDVCLLTALPFPQLLLVTRRFGGEPCDACGSAAAQGHTAHLETAQSPGSQVLHHCGFKSRHESPLDLWYSAIKLSSVLYLCQLLSAENFHQKLISL